MLLCLFLPQGGLGRLPGGIEAVPTDPDAAYGVGEAQGEQTPALAEDVSLPDPAAGFDKIYGLACIQAILLHTFSVQAAPTDHK